MAIKKPTPSQIPEWANYIAQNENGQWAAFDKEPYASGVAPAWHAFNGARRLPLTRIGGFVPGWRDTLERVFQSSGEVTAEDMGAKLDDDEPGFMVFASDFNSVQLAQAVLDNRIADASAREGEVDADEVEALKAALDDLIAMKNWLLNNPEDK